MANNLPRFQVRYDGGDLGTYGVYDRKARRACILSGVEFEAARTEAKRREEAAGKFDKLLREANKKNTKISDGDSRDNGYTKRAALI